MAPYGQPIAFSVHYIDSVVCALPWGNDTDTDQLITVVAEEDQIPRSYSSRSMK